MTTPDKAAKSDPVTFECSRYPSLTVWRTDAEGKPLEPLSFMEPVDDEGYLVLRENAHGDPYRVGSITTSDPDEIAALDALAASHGVSRV